MSSTKLPTRTLAGITVLDTPLVRAAQAYARTHADDMTYNHVMRSWLFGVCLYTKLHTAGAMPEIDLEAHAISAILHDLGWDHTGELVSSDKCFEVDGAIAAREWLHSHSSSSSPSSDLGEKGEGKDKEWDDHRIQLVWDAIALHTSPHISRFKEPVVQICGLGIICDFHGPRSDPSGLLTWEEFEAVKREFPRLDLAKGLREKIVHFCRTKPETTYGEFMFLDPDIVCERRGMGLIESRFVADGLWEEVCGGVCGEGEADY